jgi:hypothetical protein
MAMIGVNKNKQASRVFIELKQSYLFHILTAAKKTAIALANGGWHE